MRFKMKNEQKYLYSYVLKNLEVLDSYSQNKISKDNL
jgi:hypothetical protein